MPLGLLKRASSPIPSWYPSFPGFPAIVDTTPSLVIFLMVPSAQHTNRLPTLSMQIPLGSSKPASLPTPSTHSPAPLPAKVVTRPSSDTLLITLLELTRKPLPPNEPVSHEKVP